MKIIYVKLTWAIAIKYCYVVDSDGALALRRTPHSLQHNLTAEKTYIRMQYLKINEVIKDYMHVFSN